MPVGPVARLSGLEAPARKPVAPPRWLREDRRVTDAAARMQVHDAYDLIEEEFNQQLDESLDPSGPDSLFGYVAEMGLPAQCGGRGCWVR